MATATQERTEESKNFSRGFACALTCIIRSHGFETPVEEAWRAQFGSKQTVKSLRKMGIDEYDIEVIAPHLKEINRRYYQSTVKS